MKSKSKGLLWGLGCLLFGFALMLGAILGGNSMTVYAAEEDHAHCICGEGVASGEHTACSDVTFSPYNGGDVTYDGADGNTGVAYLYLASDVLNSSNSNNRTDSDGIFMVKNNQTLYLCLNGHSMQNSVRSNNVIDVYEGGKLILCDCGGNGWIGGRTSGSNSGAVWVKGTFTMYGGHLKNSSGLKNGGGLYLAGSGSATMYGGTISDNFAFADGGGVFLDGTSSFTMYGGSISGNKATDEGGGVFVKTDTTFTMYGGVIDNNRNGSNGGGVFVGGRFIMNDGSIRGNTAAGRGGGICAENGGVMTLNGGVIENNVAHGNGGGISSCWKAALTMNGGVVKNNESKLNGGGIFLFGNGGWKDATSTFTITGGRVEKNKAGGVGGGIYFYEYTNFTMNATAADIVIMNNEGSNLYLTDNKNYVINLIALTEGSRIGVTAMRNPWIISTASETDYSRLFSADSDDYHIGYHPTYKVLGLMPHVLTKVDRIEPDCTNDGKEEYWSCACGKYFEDAEATILITDISTWGILPAYHTTLTKVDKVEPDCTNDGKEEYWSCNVCGKCYADEAATVEIADIDEWGILPVQHTFADLVAEVSATCASEGVKAHKDCGICHKHFDAEGNEIADLTIAVDSTAHRFGKWVEEVPATEDAEGVKGHKDCDFCHKHFDADGNEISDLTIARLPARVTVTVTGGTGGDANIEVGSVITITANPPEEGKAFKGWQDARGNIVGTEATYTFTVTGEVSLTAVYENITPIQPGNDGLSGGAIAGIAVGSVAVSGIGGFSVFWFAIRKKKLTDLIAAIQGIFKKK